jgi:hypothetical protein
MKNSSKKEKSTIKNGKEKNYDRAILLIQHHVQLFWLVFGAFLLSETVLLGGIASLAKDGNKIWAFYGSIFGLLLCIPWCTTFLYNHAFYQLRINEAKLFEPEGSDFFKDGWKLFNGEKIKEVSIPIFVKLLRPKSAIKFLIGLYFTVFLLITIFSFPYHMCKI